VARRACETYGRATSVSGTLECDAYGSKETWSFSVAPRKFAALKTPYRTYVAEVGRYIVYQPFDKTYYSARLLPNTLMSINELWPFSLVGGGESVPPPYFHSQAEPTRTRFAGKEAWAIGGLREQGANVEAYIDAKTGELLGWKERWEGSPQGRLFTIKSLHWNAAAKPATLVPPKGARLVPLDDMSYLPHGQPIPDVQLVDEAGGKTTLARALSGASGAVVSVGAPGCGPCEAAKRFAARNFTAFTKKNVRFVALEGGCTQADLEKIAKAYRLPFRTYRPSGPDDLQHRLKLGGLPTIYFVDSNRRVTYAQQGFEPKSFAKALAQLRISMP
jgi:hypothetical protein